MVPAARDTYRRVYRDDGTYHYPQIASNRLRRKGELYFKSMEITGSNPGTAKEPKFDLLSLYRDTELPRLDALCAEVAAVTGSLMAWTKIILGLMPLLLHMLPQILAHSMKAKQSIVDYVWLAHGWNYSM